MRNKRKGSYFKAYKDATGDKGDYVVEVGTDYDSFRIAIDFADLIAIKNEIGKIIEKAKEAENELNH
jgi:hypothetical protein